MSKNSKNSSTASLRETWNLSIRGYRIWWERNPKLLLSTAFLAIAQGLTPYVGIYLSARLINEIAGARNPQTLTTLVILSLVSAALLMLLNAGLSRWKNCQYAGLWFDAQRICTEKLLTMDFSNIDDPRIHDLYSQILQNQNWNGWGLAKLLYAFETLVKAIMTIIGAVSLATTLFILRVPEGAGPLAALNNPGFIALIMGLLLTATFVAPLCTNLAGRYWARRADSVKFGNRVFNFFGFIGYDLTRALDIRIYRQDILCAEASRNSDNVFRVGGALSRDAKGPMGGLHALAAAISHIFTAIVYVFVCLKAWAGAFGVGSVTQYIASITALSGGISSLLATVGDLQNNAVFLRTTFEFLDTPNEMYRGSLTVEKRSDRNYEIEFKNVSFRYPGTETYALQNVSMKFRVGERLAVVGMNGSGKTTFIKLLCRLYDPTEGEILLNGIDIRKYDYDEYMSIFSVVFQDFKLLSFHLGQNVAARMAYDKIRTTECLEKSGFGDRLERLPNGLETCLYKDFDEKGVDVSGGEAQKIGMARALYKDASFIVLDEPTAALDPIAEFEVYSKMNDMVGAKTAVFISHRLSSCRFCHDIAVFHEGRIIQRGSHEALVGEADGKYAELWNAQAKYYTA